MAVDLADYVPALRREVTPPGGTQFADVSDDVFTGYLADSFWEARLDGFVTNWSADPDGIVTPLSVGGADLPRQQIAALIVYAGVRILRTQILNTQTAFRAQAGPVEYEVQNSATMLVELLKQLKAVKDQLIDDIRFGVTGTSVGYIDAYATRLGLSDQYAMPNGNRFLSGGSG